MDSFNIKLAENVISMNCKYSYTSDACKAYAVNTPVADFSVFASDKEIETEMKEAKMAVHAGYAEFICLYRKIAERLPLYNCMVVHGAAITYKGSALLFTAPSGTGKSTHIKLWKSFFKEDVDMINGDKPILRVFDDRVTVYGTPWAGKENWHKNRYAPLKAICVLKRSEINRITKVTPTGYVSELLKQVYLPKDTDSMKQTLELFNKLIETVSVYVLECNISENAVVTAYNGIVSNFESRSTESSEN